MKGRSYSSIHSYFAGAEPPLEFLEAAADVLGVSLGWLRTGEGPMEPPTIGKDVEADTKLRTDGRVDTVQLFSEESRAS